MIKLKLVVVLLITIGMSFLLIMCNDDKVVQFENNPKLLAKLTVDLYEANGDLDEEQKIFAKYNMDTTSGKRYYINAIAEIKKSKELLDIYEKEKHKYIITSLGNSVVNSLMDKESVNSSEDDVKTTTQEEVEQPEEVKATEEKDNFISTLSE